jgi:predicted DNA-binding protein with PD1-like motif
MALLKSNACAASSRTESCAESPQLAEVRRLLHSDGAESAVRERPVSEGDGPGRTARGLLGRAHDRAPRDVTPEIDMDRMIGTLARYAAAPMLAAFCASCAPRTAAGPNTPIVRWVKPSETAPRGRAPGARFRLVSAQPDGTKTFALVLSEGDDVGAALATFAGEEKVQSGHFSAIGAVRDAEVAWFDEGRKEFKVMALHEQMEVVGLSGDVTVGSDGRPAVHAHVALARNDGGVWGGHLLEATVSPTLEVFVTTYPVPLHKRPDPATGLQLIDPSLEP